MNPGTYDVVSETIHNILLAGSSEPTSAFVTHMSFSDADTYREVKYFDSTHTNLGIIMMYMVGPR